MTSPLYFPIAACNGIAKPDAASYDKRWLIVDDNGVWLTRDQCEKLADIKVDVSMGCLVMRAPGMLRLDIPLDVLEDDDSVRGQAQVGGRPVDIVDEGELVATWVSKFLERPCRLVKVHPDAGPVFWPQQ
ncbi:MOSC N-terminal beta barrel domain-containing protein [Pollutimonas bauzanensis]|uniref:MOSC N-terminal beta barrel domain-containing protein n=1 Tax=Pollutimonas bauzanensis TaxID=658167 RepID=UPI0033400AE8